MSELHDFDKLKQEEQEAALQQEENELFKLIEPYIIGINNTIRVFSIESQMSDEEIVKYVRETVSNFIEG